MFFLTISTASAYTCSMSMPDLDVVVNGLEYLPEEDTIDDNANYLDKNFGPLSPTSNPIDSTDWTKSQEQIEWVNPYGNTNNLDSLPAEQLDNPYSNTDNLDSLPAELLDHKPWDVASQDNIDFNNITTSIDVISPVHTLFQVQSNSKFCHFASLLVRYVNTSSCCSLSEAGSTLRPEKKKLALDWKIIKQVWNREPHWIAKDSTKFICQTIKEYTKFMLKPWQVSVMSNIVYEHKDVVVSASTDSGKSLPY